jgi:hypothetical protein
LANNSFRILWDPEKGRTDIEKGVEVEAVSIHAIGSSKRATGRGFSIRLRVKGIAMLFDKLMAILHFLSQTSKSAR